MGKLQYSEPDTALGAAFAKAGVKSAETRLQEIAIKAMVEHADNTFATSEAMWAEIQKHRDLMIELFQYDWRRAVGALLHRTQRQIETREDRGELRRPIERKAAVVLQMIRREDEREAKEHAEREAISIAEYKAEQERAAQQWLAKWQVTRIGSLTISDKPVWQCTAGTVRSWLEVQKRRWHTVELLIEGLPDDGRPIEYYRKPEEVQALWEAAGAE